MFIRNLRKAFAIGLLVGSSVLLHAQSSEITIVRPVETDEVLTNPGIGFTTFNAFNGDTLVHRKLTEGYPPKYQSFDGDIINKDYPQTTLSYFRVNWRFLEPKQGEYNWPMIDKALKTAAERGQTLMVRISTYEGKDDKDVPDWFRKMVGKDTDDYASGKWRFDPEDPRYLKYFGGFIEALGQRYDGHPDLESVDISIIGYWGEGDGSHLLSDKTRIGLVRAYLDNFKKTPLIFQPLNGDSPDPGVLVDGLPIAATWADGRNNGTGSQMRNVGWRIDCLGDMGFWEDNWNHMLDVYPQDIVRSGMQDAWKKAPIAMEVCGSLGSWKNKKGYDEKMATYIFEQALKWHISSFNAKSSPVPEDWMPMVNKWLNRMGYRFVLRKFTFPSEVRPQGQVAIKTWWENKGVAPIYKDFKLALRFSSDKGSEIKLMDVDIRNWYPGDIVYDDNVYLPHDMAEGEYDLELAIVSKHNLEPMVKLAIEGRKADGWYPMGKIIVKETLTKQEKKQAN